MGSLTYKGGHSYCEGRDANVNGEHMVSLLVTENLEFTMKTVMVREGFDSGDILVIENGASISATLR